MRLLPGMSDRDSGLFDPIAGVPGEHSLSSWEFTVLPEFCSKRHGFFKLSLVTTMAPEVPAHFWRNSCSKTQAAQIKLS